jgi:hypothetical protein
MLRISGITDIDTARSDTSARSSRLDVERLSESLRARPRVTYVIEKDGQIVTQSSSPITRKEAVKSIFDARSISPSSNDSLFLDVDNKIAQIYVGYIARGREIGCIDPVSYFRPDESVSQ